MLVAFAVRVSTATVASVVINSPKPRVRALAQTESARVTNMSASNRGKPEVSASTLQFDE